MYKIWHLNYSLMERRATNLRYSSLLTLDLWIQSSLRSQVKWVRLSQYSLYGCLFASQRHQTVFNVSGADGSRNPESKKCFTSRIASLAEIESTANLRRSTICELPRLTARCIKICIPNAVVYSVRKRGSRILVFVCQSHPVGIALVPSSCSFMQNSCQLEILSGWPRAHMHYRPLADIGHWVPKLWSSPTEGIAIITTVKAIPLAIDKYHTVAVLHSAIRNYCAQPLV